MSVEITVTRCKATDRYETIYEVELTDEKIIQGERFQDEMEFQWVLAESEMHLYDVYPLPKEEFPEHYL